MKKEVIIMLTIAALLLTVVTASANPTILYNGVPVTGIVNVSVHPDPITPPISIQYNGLVGSTYKVTLVRRLLPSPVCVLAGRIDTDPFVLDLNDKKFGKCSIPAIDHDSIHTLTACVGASCSTTNVIVTAELRPICDADCQRDQAEGGESLSSQYGPIAPIPEISTIGMVSLGIIGLLIFARNYKKN